MARAKSKLRRVLNARFLRWWFARALVLACPPLGRWLGFFPRSVGLIEAADHVVQNHKRIVPKDKLVGDLPFLKECLEHDSVAADLELPDAVVTGDRTVLIDRPWIDLSTGSILLPERARTVLVRGPVANWNATSIRAGRRKVRVPGLVFTPLKTANYYHLLLENALRILELSSMDVFRSTLISIVKAPHVSNVEAAFYEAVVGAYPDISVRIEQPGALVLPDQAIGHFPVDNHWEWARFDRPMADGLRDLFQSYYGEMPDVATRKLYLTRTGAKLRAPTNSEELDALLESHGVGQFTATDINHPEQIARFGAAETIVAIHGAGLTNLLFARPGAHLIEIFPKNFVKSTYWWMARQLGLRYTPLIGGRGNYDQHFEVPVDALSKVLEQG